MWDLLTLTAGHLPITSDRLHVDQKEFDSLFGSGSEGVKCDEVVVKKEKLDQLIKKEVMFDQMCKVIEAGGNAKKEEVW